MTGLGVLYSEEAIKSPEWNTVPDRQKTGWMRELYWMKRADSSVAPRPPIRFHWDPGRTELGRTSDEPGDAFLYRIDMAPQVESRFEWFEVTEVFVTVPPTLVEGAMGDLHGLPVRNPVEFERFRKDLDLGCPSRSEQRRAADMVVAGIEKKLAKQSYGQLLMQYGYGTLVVGLPLWFAPFSHNPWRAESALDDFATRTGLGLEDVKLRALRKRSCPFKTIVVAWETTPQALQERNGGKSEGRKDLTGRSMEGTVDARIWDGPPDILESASSLSLQVSATTRKKASGRGPYPEYVKALEGRVGKLQSDKTRPMERLRKMLTWKAGLWTLKLISLVRMRGRARLTKWTARKLSFPNAWNKAMARRKMRRLYRESVRRNRAFGRASEALTG